MLASWSEAFSRALAQIGWPGERALNSAEFQTVEKFKEALRALATLDRLLGRLDLASAVAQFRRLLEQTAFQPETGDAAVTVTSRLGDPVLVYDGIWVSGVHAAAWPEPPRPDPFIPWPVQAAVGMPGASAHSMVERAQRTLASWMASANDLILSWPARRDEELYDPSPLIVALPDLDASSLRRPRYSEVIHASARRERIVDEIAPPVATDRPKVNSRTRQSIPIASSLGRSRGATARSADRPAQASPIPTTPPATPINVLSVSS